MVTLISMFFNFAHFQGYVDDMVQDVVDCLAWIHSNIHHYGGDKVQFIL